MAIDFQAAWQGRKTQVDAWLDRLLPPGGTPPAVIHEAMRYSVFAGGKRLRAVLAVATADALGCRHPERYAPACALELIHTYSLIHDDLPAMDDDDLRRGMPTSHKKYGEAVAILAGDALLTHAFLVLSRYPAGEESAPLRSRIAGEIAEAAGSPLGMVAGQVLDITAPAGPPDAELLTDIHRLKTGAMIRASVRTGALLGQPDETDLAHLTEYSEALGLAFQITDDILDVTSTREALGKTPGKDVAQHKLTFPAIYGVERSRKLAMETVERALAALAALPASVNSEFLVETARYILSRRS
jgi:geranylgeranyl diphosphate synthase, type II